MPFPSGNRNLQKASRPFDRDRDGLVPSGGAATVILESYESATKRGATILGEVIGYGFSSNGEHISLPNVEGPARAMAKAMQDAGIEPDRRSITSMPTPLPPLPATAMKQKRSTCFSETTKPLVSSTKSMTGHEMWMGGASEVIYSILMMNNGFIAPEHQFRKSR